MAAEQCIAVAVVLAVGVYALVDGLSIGMPLTIAAAVVLAGLLARVGALVESRHDRAVDLIAEGRGSLPVEAVLRARRRLRDPVGRERLARTFDVIRTEVARPARACHSMQSMYTLSVVRAASSELGEVARLVRAGGALRGVARAERLVTDGRSPLYGDADVVLRQELGRIRFLLLSPDADQAPDGDRSPFRAGRRSRSFWTGPSRSEVTVVRSLRRFLRREPPQETPCPRCGTPAPPHDIECSACGWDLRDAYHDPLVEGEKDAVAGDRGA